MSLRTCTILTILFACLSWQQTCVAVVTTYDSRAAWLAAIGGSADYLVDFNNFSAVTSFETAPLGLGPFSIYKKGFAYSVVNRVNVGGMGIDNSPYAQIFVDSDAADTFGVKDEVELTFDKPIWAWAADFSSFAGGERVVIEAPGGLSIVVPDTPNPAHPNLPGQIFFGFATSPSEPISRFSFKPMLQLSGAGENFVIDNVAAETVPEPTTLAIALLGISIHLISRSPSWRVFALSH